MSVCGVASSAHARMASFVADAVQKYPGHEERRGKLFVSEWGTRFEFFSKNQKVIQIIQPAKGLYRLLFPATRTYFEIKSTPALSYKGQHLIAPCRTTKLRECRKKTERKTPTSVIEHWLVTYKGMGKIGEIWWDRARHLVVRQIFPDGSTMVAQMDKARRFEGRRVEPWKMTLVKADGRKLQSYMLFAPDLGLPIMEQGSKGSIKELHAIKRQALNPALYEIPDGYKKIRPPINKKQ